MPFIPTIVNQDSPLAGAPQARGNAVEFGANVGAAMIQAGAEVGAATQNLGGEIQKFGSVITSIGEKQQASKDALATANILSNNTFTPTYNDTVINHPNADGSGLTDDINAKWDTYKNGVLDQARKQGLSGKALTSIEIDLARQHGNYIEDAAKQQTKMKEESQKLGSQTGLDNIMFNITQHGATTQSAYERELAGADKLIAAQDGLTLNQREEARIGYHNKAAIARFDTLKDAAKTPAELDVLKKDLSSPFWQKELTPSDAMKEANQIDASSTRWAELGIGTTASPHVNAVRADVKSYDAELAAGLKELNAMPNPDEVKKQAGIADFKSNMASARFESTLEHLPTDDKAALDVIANARKEAATPAWRDLFNQGDYDKQLASFDRHENAIQQDIKAKAKELQTATEKAFSVQEAQLKANISDASHVNEQGGLLTNDQWQALRDGHTALAAQATKDNPVSPELESTFNRIFQMQNVYREKKHLPLFTLEAEKRAEQIAPSSELHPNNWAPMLQGLNRGGYGPATINNLDPEMGAATSRLLAKMPPELLKTVNISNGWRSPDPSVNPIRRDRMHADPRSSMHGQGKAMDIHGSDAAMNWLHANAGSEGLRFPLTGQGGLPLEAWHMELASNRDANGRIVASAYTKGGGAAAGGGKNFYNSLSGFEASNTNAPHSYTTTSSGMARGYFQITDGTWKDFGGLATGYKTAYDAPYDVQKQIADKIPINRWAPETLNKMQKAGWKIYPTMTLAENAAANGSGPGAPSDSGAGGVGGAVATAGGGQPALTSSMNFEQSNRVDAYDKLIANKTSGLNTDMIAQSVSDGVITENSLLKGGDDAWTQRVKDYAAAQAYNGVVTQEQKQPFMQAEAAAYGNILASNDNAAKMQLYKQINSWPEAMQADAYRQLKQTQPFGAEVGRLTPNQAAMAMNGNDLLKAVEAGGGKGAAWQNEADKAFLDTLGGAVRGMDPTSIPGAKRVYDSVYANQNGVTEAFDTAKYQKIVEDIEGGPIGSVNGMKTIMPKDVTDGMFERALPGLDYKAVSADGQAPLAKDGQGNLTPVADWAKQLLKPIRLEPGMYGFINDQGQFLSVPDAKSPTGVRAYVAKLDAPTIATAAARTQSALETTIRGVPVTEVGIGGQSPTDPLSQLPGQELNPINKAIEDAKAASPQPDNAPPVAQTRSVGATPPSLTTGVPGEPPGVAAPNAPPVVPPVNVGPSGVVTPAAQATDTATAAVLPTDARGNPLPAAQATPAGAVTTPPQVPASRAPQAPPTKVGRTEAARAGRTPAGQPIKGVEAAPPATPVPTQSVTGREIQIPKTVNEEMLVKVSQYRAALIRAGRSEEYAKSRADDFLKHLRDQYYAGQR